jgi:hypothetical protein
MAVNITQSSDVPLKAGPEDSRIYLPPPTTDGLANIFKVTSRNGFLPLVSPLRSLPKDRFAALDAVRVTGALPSACGCSEGVIFESPFT